VNHLYLFAVAAGVTLLVASLLLGGKDTDHGGHGGEASLGWAPFASLRFWVFFLAFGGGAGLALDALESNEVTAAVGAGVVGWAAGAVAVAVIRMVSKQSASSEVGGAELVGTTGTLVLPVGPGRPGKVRVDVKGRTEDFVANIVDDGEELPTGTAVLVVAEGERGSLLVAKGEM
jgi:membrane protein implicated in regulation of membrane protease activity